MSRDSLESWANAIIGLAVSIVAVRVLRATGGWDSLGAGWIAALFFGLSFVRARALRTIFRNIEARHGF